MTTETKRHKRGDIRPDGRVFWGYNRLVKTGEYWISIEKYKKYKAYEQSPKRKAKQKAREQSPERKAYMKDYRQKPKFKAYCKARDQSPKRKAYEKNSRESISDSYVAGMLGLKTKTARLCRELLEAKREQIKILRELKPTKRTKQNAQEPQ